MQCVQLQQEKFLAQTEGSHKLSRSDSHGSSLMQTNDMDIFISKFLRSEKGFKILKENGWLDHKLQDWNENGGMEYIMRL